MCEWLRSGEWCDVQMFCGGRAFNAHRVVLASVSAFLRRILISCPAEELPTYIVLPDFDLEAFSSVLYYIYNGEVTIHKQKLQMFIDILKVLEIYVDHQSLLRIRYNIGDSNLDLSIYSQNECPKNNAVFALSSCRKENQHYVNIRKGERSQDMQLQYMFSDSDFCDKQARCENTTEIQPLLRNLPSPYADRQRNSFLRDLFAETYPRNGNVNGLTASVLAISNERYRDPTSVLLTNANSKHHGARDTLSENGLVSTRTGENVFYTPCEQNFITENSNLQGDICSRVLAESVYSQNSASACFENEILLESGLRTSWKNSSILKATQSILPLELREPLVSQLPSESKNINSDILNMQRTQINGVIDKTKNNSIRFSIEDDMCMDSTSNLTKISIFNQVLENPWRPRLPKNYRPFFKKRLNSTTEREDSKTVINDKNNNIPQPIPSSANEVNRKINNDKENSSKEFKCIICNHVFKCSESLSEHARHHSAAGRYTCGECGKTFSQLRNFKYHMSVHRGTREFAATCPVCGKYFNDRGYLSSHMKIHRNRKEYKCSMCPKSFNQRVAYNMHVRIHTGVKPHVCEQCGKAFSRKMLLKQHQRTHSGERPYACSHCDKRFADRSNMTLHLRLHTGVKPFSCSLCPKSFTKKHHLKSHLNFHTGAKPYSCPRCKLAFTQSSNMRTHLKKCNAPEPSTEAN